MQKRAHDSCRCNIANGRLQRCKDDRHGPFFHACLLDLYNSLEALAQGLLIGTRLCGNPKIDWAGEKYIFFVFICKITI